MWFRKEQKNIDFLKNMAYDELIKLIGCRCSPSTHIQLFELIRCNPDLPQNQNMLLTSMDSKIVYWNSTTGWRQGDFNEQIHGRIADDALFLVEKIPPNLRDPEFYGSHMHEVLRNCGEMTNPLMKQIAEGIRRPLHEATMNLVAKYRPVVEEETPVSEEASSSSETIGREDVSVLRERIQLVEAESRKSRDRITQSRDRITQSRDRKRKIHDGDPGHANEKRRTRPAADNFIDRRLQLKPRITC